MLTTILLLVAQRPDDETLRRRYYEDREWASAKRHYVRALRQESRDKRWASELINPKPLPLAPWRR